MIVGGGFSNSFDPHFKSPRELVHLLIDVVCRGGNLALNLAPQPNGRLPAEGVRMLDGMGDWLRPNGEAIYGTRMAEPNESGRVAFTKKGNIHYALVRQPEGEPLQKQLLIPWPGSCSKLTLLDLEANMSFKRTDDGLVVDIPNILVGSNPIAPVFRIEP